MFSVGIIFFWMGSGVFSSELLFFDRILVFFGRNQGSLLVSLLDFGWNLWDIDFFRRVERCLAYGRIFYENCISGAVQWDLPCIPASADANVPTDGYLRNQSDPGAGQDSYERTLADEIRKPRPKEVMEEWRTLGLTIPPLSICKSDPHFGNKHPSCQCPFL